MSTSILPYIQTRINDYGYPIFLAFGDVGNIFILILFYQQRNNSCSIYLLSSAIGNILYLTIGGLFKILVTSYSDGSLKTLILCKFSNYTPGFFGQVTKTLLIFACIDRYMITSKNARLRAFSTPKRAKYISCATYIIWVIIPSHILVESTISYGQCTKVGWYVTFYAFYALLLIGFIPSIVLCIFSYLTLRNMQQLHNRIQPTEQDASNNNNINKSLKRRDRDLSILVLAEAIVFIITTGPYTLVSVESMITLFMFPMKSLSLLRAEIFAANLSFLLIFIFSALPFYTYLVASASFRRDFKQLILSGYQKVRRLPPDQSISRSIQRMAQQETNI